MKGKEKEGHKEKGGKGIWGEGEHEWVGKKAKDRKRKSKGGVKRNGRVTGKGRGDKGKAAIKG